VLDGDGPLRAVVGADAGLLGQRAFRLRDEQFAVPVVVGREHVGRQRVAAAVADTEIGVDGHAHGRDPMLRPMRGRVALIGVLLVALASACSGDGNDDTSEPGGPTTTVATGYRLDDTLRLHQVQVLGSHNSYHGRPHAEVLAEIRRGTAPALADTLDYEHAPL